MRYRFKNCEVLIDHALSGVTTRFDDGTTIRATPQFDAENVSRALSLGYREPGWSAVLEMTRWHDLLHTVIAEARGEPWSPTLHAAAHGYQLAAGVNEQEERVVLFVQRALASGIDAILNEKLAEDRGELLPNPMKAWGADKTLQTFEP